MNDTSRTPPAEALSAPRAARTKPDACPIVFGGETGAQARDEPTRAAGGRDVCAITFDDPKPSRTPLHPDDTPQARPIVFDEPAPAHAGHVTAGGARGCQDNPAVGAARTAASAVTFASPEPTPPRVARGPAAPSVMGGAADSSEVIQAIAQARQQGGAAWQRAQTAVEGAIRQLLPFSLERLATWGNSALQDNARLVEAATSLQRAQSVLGVNEIIQQALDARTPHRGFLERLRGAAAPVNPGNLRVRAAGLSARLGQLAPQIEALRQQVREQAERMDVLVTALSCAAQVGGNRLDTAVDTALQNRRTVLLQASQQAQLLLPQIDEMRRQLTDHEARLTQFISVTLPAMDMAAAQAAG